MGGENEICLVYVENHELWTIDQANNNQHFVEFLKI